MSEVHRYKVAKMFSESGNKIEYFPPGPWVVTASDFDAQRLRADTAEGDLLRTSDALIAAEQRIAELISEVASRDAALEELGCPFEGVSDLFNDYAKGGKRYQWLRAHLSVDDFPKPHPEWSQPSEVESRRIDDLVDAALNPSPEAESHE